MLLPRRRSRADGGTPDLLAGARLSGGIRARQPHPALSAILGMAPVRHRRRGGDLARRPDPALGPPGAGFFRARARPSLGAVAEVVARGAMLLPSVAALGGPFPGCRAQRVGDLAAGEADSALAALYIALMSDTCLDLLGARGAVVIDGAFVENPAFAAIVAPLRPDQ